MYYSVNIIILDEVFSDLLFSSSSIENSWKLDNSGCSSSRQPLEHMECEGKISFTLGGEYSGRSKTRIIDEDWIGITFPVDRIGRIGYYRIKWLIIPVFRVCEGISMSDVEFLIVDVMEEHIDTTEIVGGDVDLLTIKSLTNIVFSEYFSKLEKKRSRSTTRIIDFIHFCLAYGDDLGKELTHFLWSEEFSSRFSGIRCIHTHQILISITKGIDSIITIVSELKIRDRFEELSKFLIS